MRVFVLALSGIAFSIALGLQLALNDIPGAFVCLPVALVLAVLALSRRLASRGLGCLPIVLATAGYFVARAIEGDVLSGYRGIADMFAILLCLGALLLYALAVGAASFWASKPE